MGLFDDVFSRMDAKKWEEAMKNMRKPPSMEDMMNNMYDDFERPSAPTSRIRNINSEAVDMKVFSEKYDSVSINSKHERILEFLIEHPYVVLIQGNLYGVPEFIYEIGDTMAPNTFIDKLWSDHENGKKSKMFNMLDMGSQRLSLDDIDWGESFKRMTPDQQDISRKLHSQMTGRSQRPFYSSFDISKHTIDLRFDSSHISKIQQDIIDLMLGKNKDINDAL